MLGFDGNSSSHPPSCLVSIYAENSSTTVPVLNYSVPLKGALHVKDTKQKTIVIFRSLRNILSSKTNLESANYMVCSISRHNYQHHSNSTFICI